VSLNVLRVPIFYLFDPVQLIYIHQHYRQEMKYFIDIRYEHLVNGGRPLGPESFELFTDILMQLLKLKILTSVPAY
jgi:hypothetical protein